MVNAGKPSLDLLIVYTLSCVTSPKIALNVKVSTSEVQVPVKLYTPAVVIAIVRPLTVAGATTLYVTLPPAVISVIPSKNLKVPPEVETFAPVPSLAVLTV